MGLNVISMTPKYYYLILLSQRGSSETGLLAFEQNTPDSQTTASNLNRHRFDTSC